VKAGDPVTESRERRGRLFWKYTVVLVVLVSLALLASGGIELYFSYRENTEALGQIQREKALGAASRIDQFVREIERQMAWTTQPLLATGTAATEQRRLDYFRMLRQVPAVTEISQIDAAGREQLRVSRLAMDVVGSGTDFSRDPRFLEPRPQTSTGPGQTYFSPVYFRKESEPYMTVSMAGSGGGKGVTAAEVNLKFIWEVVSQIKIGRAGRAYVVDGRGQLIAHPDISLVLKKTDLSGLPQVQAAVRQPVRTSDSARLATVARDLQGRSVLTAHAEIAPLGWVVFVEQPLEEAFATLSASITRTLVLLATGVALSVLASLLLAQRMVNPIRVLQAGAARLEAGALDQRIAVRTGDELEGLAEQFNRMAATLQESYAGLERKVDERTSELREALEQQTATADVLRVISSSPTDLQPVYDVILENITRLCESNIAALFVYDGDVLFVAGSHGTTTEFGAHLARSRVRPSRETTTRLAALERRVVHVPNLLDDPSFSPKPIEMYRRENVRTVLSVPMLRENALVGVITTWRREIRPFTETQIALVRTFADQAVIAIENVRLFQELQARTRDLAQSLEEVQTFSEVGQALSSSLDLRRVLETVATQAVKLSGCDACGIFDFDPGRGVFEVVASHNLREEYLAAVRATVFDPKRSAIRRATESGQPVQIADLTTASEVQVRDRLLDEGFRALLAVSMGGGEVTRGLVLLRRAPGAFDERIVALVTALASQSQVAVENARLFKEVEDQGRQLTVANQHKSEFLANMSHELRTPLNAVIGFSEVLLERMFGDLNRKQEEYLQDIVASGRHLLSLINDILDLSKVEAGRMELELGSFDLQIALENALTLVRERAVRRGIRLELKADSRLGAFVGDERKFKQILLNLLSNAVKFTPEGGRVTLASELANGSVEVSVSDTGIGIAREDQEAIFEEFRQVGRDYASKREGTGLGLTLAKKFVELHGGKIWVKSEVGRGSTFTIALPLRGKESTG
jgi:signal transduction histidine kinase